MTRPLPLPLGERDAAVLGDLARVRLLTGRQLERLHFHTLATANARGSARRRSLGRLTHAGLVTTLPRQVGGVRAGSAGLVYTPTTAGYRLLHPSEPRHRHWPVGWPFVLHTLDVAELYVRLRERERLCGERLVRFDAEPASWHRSAGQLVKPDAFAVREVGRWEEHLWLEVDRATESLPALARELRRYLDLASSGGSGPLGVLPYVVITVPSAARLAAVRQLIAGLAAPADQLLRVELFSDTFAAPP
jgi:hypothetical protein